LEAVNPVDTVEGLDRIDEYFNNPMKPTQVTEDANETHVSNFFRETKWDKLINVIGPSTLSEVSDTSPTCEDFKIFEFLKRSVTAFLEGVNRKLVTSIPEILRLQIMCSSGENPQEKKKMFNPVSKAVGKYSKHIALILLIIIRGFKTLNGRVENFNELFPTKSNNILLALGGILEQMRVMPSDSEVVVDTEELLYELVIEEPSYDKSRNDFILMRAFAFSCYISNNNSFCPPSYIGQRLAALKFLSRCVIVKRIMDDSIFEEDKRSKLLKTLSRQENYVFTHVCSLKTLAMKYSNVFQKSNIRFQVDPKNGELD
jgi:hypothetical protein